MPKNRRYLEAPAYPMTLPGEVEVRLQGTPPAQPEVIRGIHLLREGQRLDALAAKYLGEAVGYWRLCDVNDAMTPDVLAERRELYIPFT